LIFARFPNLAAIAAKNVLLSRVDLVPAFEGLVATGGRLNAFMTVTDPDLIAPGPIADLSVIEVNGTRVKLRWTATGDGPRCDEVGIGHGHEGIQASACGHQALEGRH